MQKFKKVLVIDNEDSFTFNLVDYLRQNNCEVKTFRNTVAPTRIGEEDCDLVVLSPGPSVPRKAGNLMGIIETVFEKKPILGVCLGHQALVEFFGGTLKYVTPVHGKADKVLHDGKTVYTGLANAIEVARYHSLAADAIPNVLEVSARTTDGTIMSVRHKHLPIEGIQFHPESVISMRNNVGMHIIQNVVRGKLSTGNIEYFHLMRKLQADEMLTDAEIASFVDTIVDGQLSEDQKLILLVSFSHKLKKPLSLFSFIKNVDRYKKFHACFGQEAIDVCGTGGSNLPRLNTSTLVALTLASLGCQILKHGNRGASGRFGSFDLLEKLDVEIAPESEKIKQAFEKTNLAFLFAPHVHPAIAQFANSRARVGVPTIFNVLGPLLNPCNPPRQFIGTAFAHYMELILETAILMGKRQVMVARGEEGLDEISVSGPTKVLSYKEGRRSNFTIHPREFGIESISFDEVKVESASHATSVAMKIIGGEPSSEHYKLVAVNAAFVYSNFFKELPLRDSYQIIVETIRAGKLQQTLETYTSIVA